MPVPVVVVLTKVYSKKKVALPNKEVSGLKTTKPRNWDFQSAISCLINAFNFEIIYCFSRCQVK